MEAIGSSLGFEGELRAQVLEVLTEIPELDNNRHLIIKDLYVYLGLTIIKAASMVSRFFIVGLTLPDLHPDPINKPTTIYSANTWTDSALYRYN